VRPGCGKVFGKRPARTIAASAPSAPALTLASSATGEAPKRSGVLAGAAARLAAQRGLAAVPALAVPESAPREVGTSPDGAARDVVAPSESERESLSEWLLPAVPELVEGGCKWSIRKAGREPLDPDPVWEKRWEKSYHQSLGHYVPRLEMHPAVALLVATLFLWLSMFVGAKKLAKEDKGKADKLPATPAPSSAPSAPGEAQEVAECQTPAVVQSHADSPRFVGDSGESELSLELTQSSLQPDASGADGSVMNAKQHA